MSSWPLARLAPAMIGRRTLCLAIVTGCLAIAGGHDARAALEIDITQGRLEPQPIAIPGFATRGVDSTISANVTRVIRNNLQRSGLFLPIDIAFAEAGLSVDDMPDFAALRPSGALFVVIGRLMGEADNQIRADFRLWDIISGEQLIGKRFFTGIDNWRRMAHIISDAIYERLTGEAGYFDSQIVFIEENGPRDNRAKRLAIMDQDGANLEYLTDGSELVLTPRFSPNGREIAYMAYSGSNPQVYLLNVETGEREIVGNFPGMTFAPRFSPDGDRILMSLQQGANANIFEMNLRSRETVRLTHGAAIDTSPSYAPDARHIVFESDRGGSQQLYVMRADGTQARRISFGPGRYSTPVWSPRGDLIAFTKMHEGRFMIGVIRPDGKGERILSEGYHNEGPSWSPNGRVLVFFRESPGEQGGARLWTVDQTGYNELELATRQFASDPAWSPIRK